MYQKGTRLFYDKITGIVFFEVREQQFDFDADDTTVEQDIATFRVLSERNRDTFDVLELPFGAYSQDFRECSGYRVNVETKELEFSYPDPNEPDVEQPYQAPLSEQVATLEEKAELQEQAIVELTMYVATIGV